MSPALCFSVLVVVVVSGEDFSRTDWLKNLLGLGLNRDSDLLPLKGDGSLFGRALLGFALIGPLVEVAPRLLFNFTLCFKLDTLIGAKL